ncbi:MAG: AbrB family transcriptional regulator [Thermococcus sp.]|uniref:AbrB family transcriptional regulator n=1 Tax=Thermococcus guaymasensis DSM 11113 TaxID=1432656 RepID=A0A0X1KIQ3_9EURY|nr:AbrB family transcriptional regulator [Thermococcus guaymasensis]AJC71154.1 AbrB family transcriptional regulator [Thermococcus guaymasensis DSM 11113]MCD6523908.1 AbrB family transcriptional regulator [Thermococcus sp.]
MLAKVDSRGRLYIPKELRRDISGEVYLVRVSEGILIVPKPEDPLRELEELGKKLPDVSIEELRREILKEAEKLAGG